MKDKAELSRRKLVGKKKIEAYKDLFCEFKFSKYIDLDESISILKR